MKKLLSVLLILAMLVVSPAVAETSVNGDEKRTPGECPWDFEQIAKDMGYSGETMEYGVRKAMEARKGSLLAKGYSPEEADEIVEKARRGEPLTPFQVPDYDAYNSPAEKNGHGGDLLLLSGTVKKYVKDGTSSQYVIGIRLEQEDGREWMISCAQYINRNLIGEALKRGDTVFDGLEGKNVEIYGKYSGFSEEYKLPVVDITRCGGLFLPDEDTFICTLTSSITMNQEGIYDLPYLIGAKKQRKSTERYRP